jgi:hypothetical protein
MPGLKNKNQGTVISVPDFNMRTFSTTDAAYDFYTKSLYYHGYVYSNLASGTTTFSMPANGMHIGPCNEVTLQIIGTAGNIASAGVIQGSIDGTTFVNVNLVTSADGLLRIQSKYRYLYIHGVTGLDASSALYMMIS